MPKLTMCKAVCGECCRDFPYPSLGEFAYGSFILTREDGQAYRYLEAIGNPVWDFVAARMPIPRNEADSPCVSVLQEVVARLADRSQGKLFTMDMVCPYCKSRRFRSWGGDDVSLAEIPDATFRAFTALDESSKQGLVKELKKLIHAEQSAAPNSAPPDRGACR